MSAYFTQTDLENRLGARVVADVFDDDNSGNADTGPIAELISDASSKVDSYLRAVYRLPLTSPIPNEVKRLALDVAVALAAQRHPEALQRDWKALMVTAETELEKLRDGKTRLDVETGPNVAVNEGGAVAADDTTATGGVVAATGPLHTFIGGMGDW